MNIYNLLELVGGLSLFLFGMEVMGDSLKRSAGNRLKTILEKLTSNQFKGFLLGTLVTCIIQSSSAVTVMVVGFVNSGSMAFSQALGVIMGANLGTCITAWLTGLTGIGGAGADVASMLNLLKPSSWTPVLALIGVCILMLAKQNKKKEFAKVLLGFAVLMFGMETMSSAVSVLKGNAAFANILTKFENPVLGLLAGIVVTAIIQSSSASVGILQSLTTTGAITFNAAIPIVMGQNIGTCVTAMISSIGATKNGKRAALMHLYLNIIGATVWLAVFYAVKSLFTMPFLDKAIDMWGVAIVHTVYSSLKLLLIAPFSKYLEKLAYISVRDSKSGKEEVDLLDERLLNTPAIAIEKAHEVTSKMAAASQKAVVDAISLLWNFDQKICNGVDQLEDKIDIYEDRLGAYLMQICSQDMVDDDSRKTVEMFHTIGNFERISDHAVNLCQSSEEIKDKHIRFSENAERELRVLVSAVNEIVEKTVYAFTNDDLASAKDIEPLEEVIDQLIVEIKDGHIERLQKGDCTMEFGFILSDILTNLERIGDHCSNVGIAIIESKSDNYDSHKYLHDIKHDSREFDMAFENYRQKYALN